MKKISKILLLLLALTLVCAGLVMVVSAEEPVDVVSYVDSEGSTQEGTLKQALANAKDGTTITLLANSLIEENLEINKNITIDLGGYTLKSSSDNAFSIGKEKSFNIIGVGKIELEGQLVSSEEEGVNFSLIGTYGTEGISITHTGTLNNKIIYAANGGNWVFQNIDVYSETDPKNFDAFFEMKDDTEIGANFTFDTVQFVYGYEMIMHPGQFITNVAGKGHLTIKNSGFYTEYSAIQSGYARNEGQEIIRIENSYISCDTDAVSIKDERGRRNYVILGMDDGWKGTPYGIVNVYGSHVEANYRVFCYESDDMEASTINLYDTTVKNLGLNGADRSEAVLRKANINAYGNTAIISRKVDIITTPGQIVGSAGTRTNLVGITTATSAAKCIMVLENVIAETDPDTNETTYTYEYVPSAESEKYVWIYDPIGNRAAPYVLVERTYETVESEDPEAEPTVVETTPKSPDYYKFHGFESFSFTNSSIEAYEDYKLYYAGSKQSWETTEPLSNGKSDGYHISFGGGTYEREKSGDNYYLRYWVEPTDDSGSATKDIGKMFWIIGQMNAMNSESMYNEVGTRVSGETRKAVMAIDFDFGTESGLYPEGFTLNFTSRAYNASASEKYGQLIQGSPILRIAPDGTVTNGLTIDGTDLEELPEITLNPKNEWNHVSAVFYTDPAYEGGIAYLYINGNLAGTRSFFTEEYKDSAYLCGIRLDFATTQTIGSDFCLDNMMLRAYADYQADGECDSYVDEESGETVNVKNPEHYMISTPAKIYMQEMFAVSGNSYGGKTLGELAEIAKDLGTYVDLIRDFTGKIEENVTIVPGRYNFNFTNDSYASVVINDANGNPVRYIFNSQYNSQIVNYYWYVGEYGNAEDMANLDNYIKTQHLPGQIPTYPGAEIPDVKDIPNLIYKNHVGWHSAGDETTVDALVPITVSMALAQAGEPIYMYPSYEYNSATSYIKNSLGDIVDIAAGDEGSFELMTTLFDGETFVLLDDVHFTKAWRVSYSDDYHLGEVGGAAITIDNDYTSEELLAMKEASAKIAVDLNGHTIKVGTPKSRNSLIHVSKNTTLSVYSSVPGAKIYSVMGESGSTNLFGNRIFAIFGGTESANARLSVYNAHLNIGTVTVDGTEIPGSNLSLYGGVLVEGMTGDKSCSINVDGILGVRHVDDSSGAIMTRYYDGTFDITNSTIIVPNSASIIDCKKYTSSAYTIVGKITFDNCVLLNDGGDIITGTGGDTKNVCVTFRNVITNGKISSSLRSGKLLIEGGVKALAIDNSGSYSTSYGTNVSKVKYNVQMTLGDLSSTGVYKIDIPAKVDDTFINPTASEVYYVEPGYESLVPNGATMIVLPLLEYASASSEQTIEIKFEGLNGEVVKTEKYLKGGMPTAPEIPDYTVSSIATLVHDGGFKTPISVANANTVYVPTYTVAYNIENIGASISFYTNFNLNLYIPYEYAEELKKVNVGETLLSMKDVEVDGIQYVFVSLPITPDKANENFKFVLTFVEIIDGVTYSGNISVTHNLLTYAEAILENSDVYSEAERKLVYAALNYSNEAIKYIKLDANKKVLEVLNKYASLKDDSSSEESEKYADAKDVSSLAPAFLKVNVRLDSSPSFIFMLRKDFKGMVTISYGDTTVTHSVNDNSQRTVIIDSLAISDFTDTLSIYVEGRIGNEAIIAEGEYNLATYASYHYANGDYTESDIPEDHQIASKKILTLIDAIYNYAEMAKEYAASLA